MKRFSFALIAALACAAPSFADPPKVPPPLAAVVGEDYQIEIQLAPATTAGYGLGFDAADCLFFRGYSEDASRMTFLVRPKKKGKFVILFWTKGETTSSRLTIDATGGAIPPVDPIPDPPVTGSLYFMLIRPDGPALPAFTQVVSDPGWKALQAKGHLVADFSVSAAKAFGITLAPGTALPCVVTLREGGGKSKVVRGPIPLPTTADAILRLAEGVK